MAMLMLMMMMMKMMIMVMVRMRCPPRLLPCRARQIDATFHICGRGVAGGQWLIKMLNIAAADDDDICAIEAETETFLIASHGSPSGPFVSTSGQLSS